jgi:CRISPR-associated protein Cas1
MLNEFVYCPRLFYYEHVEGVFRHNADTRRGAALHARVDRGKGTLPAARPSGTPETSPVANRSLPEEPANPAAADIAAAESDQPASAANTDVIHSRSVSLASDRLGVTAKMDLVEVQGLPAAATEGTAQADLLAPLSVCPVDYKIGAPREGAHGPELWDADRMQLGLQCLVLRDNGYTCTQGVIYYRATKQRVPLHLTPELEQWIEAQITAARRVTAGPIPPPLVDSPKCARCSLVTICLPDETRLMREAPSHPDDEDTAQAQATFPFDHDFAPTLPHAPRPASAASSAGLPPRAPRRLIAARDDRKPLYISTTAVSIGRKSELVQIREKGEVISEVRINDLSHVAVFGPATISTALLQTLCDRDIPVSYFSSGGLFYGMTRGLSLKNVFTRLAQFHFAAKREEALRHARVFVHGKIRNQRTMLMRNHTLAPLTATERMKHAAQSALEALSLEELLGVEGAAALAYFENFSGMIKLGESNADEAFLEGTGLSERLESPVAATPARMKRDAAGQKFFSFDFARRNRRPPRDAVNALLSLGYSMLARDCTIAAHAVGFDPYVGFYHQPRFGRPALALDLMEEFRPLVADSVALTLINTRVIGPGDFIRAGDAVNLSAEGRKRFFNAYEQRMNATIVHPVFDYQVSYRRAIELQARMLAKTLTGEIEQYVPFTTR